MKQRTRRFLQAFLYEVFAVLVVGPALAFMFDESMASSLGLAIIISSVAMVWNYVFNAWFEKWESRQPNKARTPLRRVVHGLFFEGGLVVMLVPVMAWWLNTTLLHAFVADLGILAFFLVYAIVFTWAFDAIFGLPEYPADH